MKPSQVLLAAADLMERRPFYRRQENPPPEALCAYLALCDVCSEWVDGREAAQAALQKEIGGGSIIAWNDVIAWNDAQEDKATVIAALRRAVRHLPPEAHNDDTRQA